MDEDILKDIEAFRELRKQLAPVLNDKNNKLLRRIHNILDAYRKPIVPHLPPPINDEEAEIQRRMRKYL